MSEDSYTILETMFGLNNQQSVIKVKLAELVGFKGQPLFGQDVQEAPGLEELIESVRRNGVLEPLKIRHVAGRVYEVLSGRRRAYAADKAGLLEVPAIMQDCTDEEAMALITEYNLHRNNETGEQEDASGTVILPLASLEPNYNNPFRVEPDSNDMQTLMVSIRENGVLSPLIVRPHPEKADIYQIISGHCRHYCCTQLEIAEVPCIIRTDEMDDYSVMTLVQHSNVTGRSHTLPSEIAISTAKRYAELRHRGKKQDNGNAYERIARDDNISIKTVKLRLQYARLIPEFARMGDAGAMPYDFFCDIAMLSPERQTILLDVMQEQGIKRLSKSQIKALKRLSQTDSFTKAAVEIMLSSDPAEDKPRKPKQPSKISFKPKPWMYATVFCGCTDEESMQNTIESILINWAKSQGIDIGTDSAEAEHADDGGNAV